MRPTILSPVALLLSGSLALAAGPASADTEPRRLSLGDLQGIGIGTRVEPGAVVAPRIVVAPTPAAAQGFVRPQPRPARMVPAARPPLALRGPFALDPDALQAVALQPVAIEPAAGGPALVEPRPRPRPVAVRALPLPAPRPAPAIAAPAGLPLRLDAEALGSVGIGRSAGPEPGDASR